ncbi:MAG TPA: DVUA0089 family protein [Chthoniobacterales bacterium]|jgi:hypothetical protein
MTQNFCTRRLGSARAITLAALVFLGLLTAGMVRAGTYTESGDAGDLTTTAQVASGTPFANLDHINGTLTFTNGLSEGDMFEIYINNTSTFSATTNFFLPGSNNFDSQLFLFNAAGMGVEANDDDPTTGSPQSTLPSGNAILSSLPAGVYYLLITGSGRYPTDTLNQLMFANFTDGHTDPRGVYGANSGTVAINGYTGYSNAGGNYSIALTGAEFLPAVPEASIVGCLAVGLVLLVVFQRRTKRS